MKRISLLLTVLCAAGLPLTAAALDYGPSQRMLAAETSAPSLPSAHGDENPFSELVSPHRAHADDDDSSSASSSSNTSDAKPTTPTARRSGAPTPGPAAATPPKHGVLSWQSLLPGSIQ
jgi:hypothetical protein